MKRRSFLQMATSGLTGAGASAAVIGVQSSASRQSRSARSVRRGGARRLDLSRAPNFATHEHWSLTTIRSGELERRRGVTPPGAVDLRHFIPDGMRSRSIEECRKMWSEKRNRYGLSGDFECIRLGIRTLHGADIVKDDPEVWATASASISRAYEDLNGWTPRAMERSHQSHLLRTVAPQYYILVASDREAERERAFTNTLLRLDSILTMFPRKGGTDDDPFITQTPTWWKSRHVPIMPREWHDELISTAGIVPRDAQGWRAFLARTFEVAAEGGCRGLKDMLAKMRPLQIGLRSESEVPFDGVDSLEEAIIFQDWLWHEACKLASDYKWPWQVHTGTTTLLDSNPLPLEPTIERYPNVKWVMLHCWPYLSETGYLARRHENVWVDACWLPMLNPHFFRRAILEWLQYVPHNKIHCGHDAHSVEVAAGSSLVMREILEDVLTEQWSASGLAESDVMGIARGLLHNNAVDVYGIGERVN